MTQPQAAPEQAQPPPQASKVVRDIAAILAVSAGLAATSAALALLLRPFRFAQGVVVAVTRLAMSSVFLRLPDTAKGTSPDALSPTELESWNEELFYRAAFILNASKRVNQRVRAGASIDKAVAAERINIQRHLQAQINRRDKAYQVSQSAAMFGPVLGWYAVDDDRTSAECKAANGKNFDAARVPVIGWPGTVHPHCRCLPGAPHATDLLLPARPAAALELRRTA